METTEIKKEEAKKDLDSLVKEKKSELQKEAVAKMSPEELKTLEEKQKKDKEVSEAKEALKKQDEAILAKKEEERNSEEKERAKVLLEEKRITEESKLSADEKIKRVQESAQRRIDEVVNELKQMKDKSSKEAETLKKEIEKLTKQLPQPKGPDETTVLLKKKEEERLTKYLEEDKELPKESRREMPDEELQDWLLENPVGANRWIAQQELRRSRERNLDIREANKSAFVKDIVHKMGESNEKVLAKHPELDTAKREKELLDQGKTKEEIHKTLCAENEKYRISTEVVNEHPEFLTEPNGPELAATEMEKRLNKEPDKISDEEKEIADLKKQLEEKEARILELEADEGIGSVHQHEKEKKDKLTQEEDKITETMRSSGATQSMIDNAIKKHRAKRKG